MADYMTITPRSDEPHGPLNPHGAKLMTPEQINTVNTGVTLTQMLVRITPDDAANVTAKPLTSRALTTKAFADNFTTINSFNHTGDDFLRHITALMRTLPAECVVWSNNLEHIPHRGVYNGASALHTWVTRHSGLTFGSASNTIVDLHPALVRNLHDTLRLAIEHPEHAYVLFPIHKNLFGLGHAAPETVEYNLVYEHTVRDLEQALLRMQTLAPIGTLFAYIEAESEINN